MEGINALEGPPSLAKKLCHLAGQMVLRLAMVLTIIAIALPTIIRECLRSPAGIEKPGIWWWVKVKPASRIENWLWAIISILCIAGWLSWSQADQISGHYIVIANGKRTNLTIRQGEVIELPMPCTLHLDDVRLVEVYLKKRVGYKWTEINGSSSTLKGKLQTLYPFRVTRSGILARHTVSVVFAAKPPARHTVSADIAAKPPD